MLSAPGPSKTALELVVMPVRIILHDVARRERKCHHAGCHHVADQCAAQTKQVLQNFGLAISEFSLLVAQCCHRRECLCSETIEGRVDSDFSRRLPQHQHREIERNDRVLQEECYCARHRSIVRLIIVAVPWSGNTDQYLKGRLISLESDTNSAKVFLELDSLRLRHAQVKTASL